MTSKYVVKTIITYFKRFFKYLIRYFSKIVDKSEKRWYNTVDKTKGTVTKMIKRILTLLLAVITVTSVLCGCANENGDGSSEFYNYDFTEYITVKSMELKLDRATLDKELLASYRSAAKNAATTSVYGGTSENALPADGITVENGDTANIDYVGTLDGVAFAGGTAKGSDLEIGSNSFIDGFESGLVGAKVGETRALNLTFPEAYHSADLAGKSVVFTVTVNYIKRPIYPEYNEENVKKYTGSTIAELEKELIGSIIFDTMYKDATVIKYPEKELSGIVAKYIDAYTQQAQQYGMTLESYVTAAYQMSIEQFNTQIDAMAKQYVKRDLIAFYIVSEIPELKISDSEYETEANALYEDMKANGGYTGTYENFLSYNDKYDIMTSIYTNRVIKYFSDNATVTD